MDGLANCFGYMVMAFQDVITNVGRSVEKTYSAAPVISYLLCDSVHTCGDIMDAFIKRCITPLVHSRQTVLCILAGSGRRS